MAKMSVVTGQGPSFKSQTRQSKRWEDKPVTWPSATLKWKGR